MTPDYIAPELGWPVAVALCLVYITPTFARWNRARRAARKANR